VFGLFEVVIATLGTEVPGPTVLGLFVLDMAVFGAAVPGLGVFGLAVKGEELGETVFGEKLAAFGDLLEGEAVLGVTVIGIAEDGEVVLGIGVLGLIVGWAVRGATVLGAPEADWGAVVRVGACVCKPTSVITLSLSTPPKYILKFDLYSVLPKNGKASSFLKRASAPIPSLSKLTLEDVEPNTEVTSPTPVSIARSR
jgi:hypothetical protein